MLVLTRKPGEAVWIGDTVVVVHECRGRVCRLGVIADPDVPVMREEVPCNAARPRPAHRGSGCLVLARTAGQAVLIGDVRVIVAKLSQTKVVLAIDADSTVPVLRCELRVAA